jgi:hypothetical protein
MKTIMTKAQRKALFIVYTRDNQSMTYRQFRRTIVCANYDDSVMVKWCGMWLGIEPDGYTHS